MTLKMLIAVGMLYLIMMGSTFSSLGVVLPHMIQSLGLNWGQAGFGFTVLALAAGLSSMVPSLTIKRWGGRVTLGLGVLAMILAYATLALCDGVLGYDVGAALLGIGFSLIGAVPALHILGGWEERKRSLVFGIYLAFGGLGGAIWPSFAEGTIALVADWRIYWWIMAGLMGVAGTLSLAVVRERFGRDLPGETANERESGWSLQEALHTPQFYVIGGCIAATYLVASTVNAFTVSYLTMRGVGTAVSVIAFSIQSACHAAFPILMGGIAERVGVKILLVIGVAIQAVGMVALAMASSLPVLVIFAIGVGGGYGTVFLATTLSLQKYFGRKNYPQIFGSNQLFTTISVVGPAIVGWLADMTGRFDVSFYGCAGLLLAIAVGAAALRQPEKRAVFVAVPQS
jgi:MFS family permease